MSDWPTRERRRSVGLCGCGKKRTVESQIKAQIRNPSEQLGSVSRTVCEGCARRIFDAAAEQITEAVA